MSSLQNLDQWENMKAALTGSVPDGACYQYFKPFTPQEIHWHVGISVFNGIYPLPRVEMKFKPQSVDKIPRYYFVYNSFGTNANHHYRHFRAFFACQNKPIEPTPRTKIPNWKVNPLFMCMNYIYTLIWIIDVAFSIYEIIMCFKGHHAEKISIVHKLEGDVLQKDGLFQKVCTYQNFMRNDPVPFFAKMM